MAYATLKAAIQAVIKQNGNNEITGPILQQALLSMINSLGDGYQFKGVATPATNPGTPDQNVFYIASEVGTYSNFGLSVGENEVAIFLWNGSWSKQSTGAASAEAVNQLGQKIGNVNDIYMSIPPDGDGNGYVQNDLTIGVNSNWRYYIINISAYAGKRIRLRAGDSTNKPNRFTIFCHIKLLDNTVIHLFQNADVISALDFVLVDVPENAVELYISWDKLGSTTKVIPMVAYEPLDSNVALLKYQIGNLDDIYFSIPENGDGKGYYNDNLVVTGTDGDFRHMLVDISAYAGKRIRLRAGRTGNQNFLIFFCHIKLADNTVIHLYENYQIVERTNEFAFVDVPENATQLYLSWAKTGQYSLLPMMAFEPLDALSKNKLGGVNDIYTLIPENGNGRGFYADDLSVSINNDYRHYTMGISAFAGKRIRLRAGNSTSGNFYFAYFCHIKLADNTVIHLHQNATYSTYKESFVLVDVPENAVELYISWDKLTSASILPMVALEPLDSDVKMLSQEIVEKYFNFLNGNYPVLPPQIFLQSDKPIPIYKNSLLINPGDASKIDINIIAEAATGFVRKIFEIKEPIYFNNDDFAQTAKFFLQRVSDLQNLYYKNVKIYHKNVSELNGKTVKVLSLGDSLTQGGNWSNTPVTMLAQALSAYGVTVQYIGTLVRTYVNNLGQSVQIRYEGRGGWRYRTFVGLESKFSANNVIIPSETQHEWVEGVDGTIDEIKAYNPWLYPATAQDLADNPNFCFHFVVGSTVENKSYAEDPTLGTYYIFDPVRYFSERNIDIPDIVTIALGTNEWYLGSSVYGGFDNTKATNCAEFMIKQFRKVSANLKIVVIPLNNFPITRQNDWAQYCMPLCANVIRVCDNLIANGDTKLFVCPIYANGSRWLGFNGTEGSASSVSEINDLQKIGMDNNVHMLYQLDDSNYDYRGSLLACVVNLIE